MASSRTFLLLGLVFAVLLLSSEISARELAETTAQTREPVTATKFRAMSMDMTTVTEGKDVMVTGGKEVMATGHDGKLGVCAAKTQTKN
ncbi:unnamed protein product [Malus baccata var. baccata]